MGFRRAKRFEPILHAIKPCLQPTNTSSAPTAAAMLLSHYGETLSPHDILPAPSRTDDTYEAPETATLAFAAAYCQRRGYHTTLYSSDFQVLDMSWASLRPGALRQRLQAVRSDRTVACLGDGFSEQYIDDYLACLDAGGELVINPWLTSTLLRELVSKGPVCISVSTSTFYGEGRILLKGLRKTKPDDFRGQNRTHSIVVTGCNEKGMYIICDPWKAKSDPVQPEHLIAAYHAAVFHCDAMLFCVKRPR